MKVALAHDSITQLGGAERVLMALHEIYPEAPVFTLVYDQKLNEHFEDWKIISSPLQYLYNFIPRFQWLLPFIPAAVKAFDFSQFDLVISSSSIFIKAINVPKETLHINYCHTPARLLWMETDQYLKDELPAILRPLAKVYLNFMRKWDYDASARVDYFIANSKNVQQRIKQFYNRDSEIIYPFVETDKFYPSTEKENYYLIAGRLQAHKRADLVIQLFKKLGKPLHVVGTGRDLARLKNIADGADNIEFLGRIDDELLRNEYSGAKGYIYPQEEDFGIMPLEANACGTPVIAYGSGGALETVIKDRTGVFFEQQNEQSLELALKDFEQINFSSEDLFEQAEKFSKAKFKQNIHDFVTAKQAEKLALKEMK